MRTYTCRKCGKKYESDGLTEGLCNDCLMDKLDKYHQVREYLWEHPGTNASTLAAECGCTVREVMQWVREDRFMLTDGSKILLYCANCGTKITSGVYCKECQGKIARNEAAAEKSARLRAKSESMFGTSISGNTSDDGSMRFLYNKNQKK